VNACPIKEITVIEEAVYDALYAASAVGPLLANSDGSGLTEAGGTGDHLTAINLPDQTMNITGDITGNLSGSVGSVTGAVGSVTGNVGGNVTGSVGSVSSGGITRASFAAETGLQSIRSNTAQAGGASSITLDASASATTDFYKGCFVYLTGGTGAGQVARISSYNGTTKVAIISGTWATNPDNTTTFAVLPEAGVNLVAWNDDAISDAMLGYIPVNLKLWEDDAPNALVSGNVPAHVQDMATGSIDSDAVAASAVTEIQSGLSTLDAAGVRTAVGLASANLDTQLAALPTAGENADAVWDEAQAGHTTAGTFGKYLDTEVSGVGGGSAPTVAEIVDGVLDEAIAGHLTAGTVGAKINSAASAGDPWDTALPGSYADGTAGKIIGNVIPAKTNLIGESIELNAPVTDEDGGTTITVFRTDDYTTTTGQQISVTVSGWPSFPSNGVKLRASRDNSASLIFSEISCTVSASGTDQTLTADLTKEQAVLLRYGKLDDWRIEATYANGDIATPAWGKWNVLRVGT
jgi:hypothetical protein